MAAMITKKDTTEAGAGRRPMGQRVRRLIRWLLSLRGSPESIALGVSVGLFVACSPLLGIHLLMAIVFATLLGANRPAAIATSFLNNPLTFGPVYALEYWIGSLFWEGPPVERVRLVLGDVADQLTGSSVLNFREHVALVLELGRDILIPMMIGGTILGLLAGAAGYYPVLAFVRTLRRKRMERRRARRKKRRER